MRRIVIAALLFVACHGNESTPTSPSLDTAALTGKVTIAGNAVPVVSASVTVTQSGHSIATLTASTGNYAFFSGLVAGTATITAKATGFTTANATTNLDSGSNRYDIQLQPAP